MRSRRRGRRRVAHEEGGEGEEDMRRTRGRGANEEEKGGS